MLAAFVLVAATAATPDAIIEREVATTRAYDTLEYLADNIGPRLSGSPNAAAAVRWATDSFEKWGIAVANEKIMVPHWVRGAEYGRLLSHRNQQIVLTALGGSVPTPAKGITADVIEINSYDELKSLGPKVKGKIVFYNNPMDMELVRAHRAQDPYPLSTHGGRVSRQRREPGGGVRRRGGRDPLGCVGVIAHAPHRSDAVRPQAAEDSGSRADS